MDRQQVPLRVTAHRFVRAVGLLANSEAGGRAKLIFAGLFALLCGLSALNVVNSYVGRNFMTAIANRETSEFVRQAVFYVGVFAALTVAGVAARFAEERLALLWRDFITRRAVTLYLDNQTYYRLNTSGALTHPDQRMADDVRAFTITTLSFVLMVFNSSLTIIAFSGVLWSISPLLFVVAVLYAACGSYLTILLGRPLISLNYDQLDKEASFRSGLIHVREKAESILLADAEQLQKVLLLERLDDLVGNFRRITAINRNVGFFTTGYNWMIQIIPALIVAPLFISGEIEFGVITQSAAAFAVLVGAFSLIVTQFNSISNFAAVVARLSSLVEAIEKSQMSEATAIEIVEREGRLDYAGLTLLSSSGKDLVKDLSLSIPMGARVLLSGPSEAPAAALFRATAGIATIGSGRIIRGGPGEIAFVQHQPYLPQSTLRQLLDPCNRETPSDEQMLKVLDELGLGQIVGRAGGFDTDQSWEALLSLTEQQLLVFARVLLAAPRFAFLERIETALDTDKLDRILRLLSERSITSISSGKADRVGNRYQFLLEFRNDGQWSWTMVGPTA